MIGLKFIFYSFCIAVGAVAIDKMCLWLEENEWLYYRRYGMPGGSFLRTVIIVIGTLFQPSMRNYGEIKHCQMQKIKRTTSASAVDEHKE